MTSSSDNADKAAGRVLLPSSITPTRYDLDLIPDLEAFTFSGVCKIQLSTTSNVSGKDIQMHAKELCFTNASFTVVGGDDAAVECEEVSADTVVCFLLSVCNEISRLLCVVSVC